MTTRASPRPPSPESRPTAGGGAGRGGAGPRSRGEAGAAVVREADPRFEFRLNVALTTRAARDVLGLAAGDKEAVIPASDSDAREQAAALLAQLLGGRQAYDVYLRNGGAGEGEREGSSEQVIELRVASDSADSANAALLEKLGGRALLLVGTEKDDRMSGDSQFLLFAVRAIPEVWGQKDAWSRPARVTFSTGEANGRGEAGFPVRLLAAIARLPEARAQRETINQRLADWHRYLGVLERTARARQFSITYKAFRRGPGPRVTFQLEAGREPPPWDKMKSVLDEPLDLRERRGLARTAEAPAREDEDDSGDWLLGYVVEVNPERSELTVALDEDVEKLLERRTLELPRSAALVYKASGDLAQLRRLKFGLEMLEQGYAQNPRLSEFLFDATRAAKPDPAKRVTLQRDQLLLPTLNEGQHAAVEGALNAPDLFLIQGPPGTGKTTVIAEICYQNALRGQRTLIASQSNLAVDNALSRLVHHPSLRALRRGRADRVEVEGAPFLEDKVVGTWLAKTAESCERDLALRRERIRLFEELLQSRQRLEALAAAMQRYQAERPQRAGEVEALAGKIPDLKQHAEQLARALSRRAAAREALSQLEARFAPGAVAASAAGAESAGEAAGAPAAPELLHWFNHVALQQMRAALDELNTGLAAWEAEPVIPEGEPAGLAPTLELAHTARERTAELSGRLAQLRQRLDELQQMAASWYNDQAQREALVAEQQDMLARNAALSARHDQLEAQRAALEARLSELAGFDAAQVPTRAALARWAEALARAEGVPGSPSQPPEEFSTLLGRDLWASAAEQAQLHKLSAMALELRTSRVEAQRFAELAVQVSGAVERLAPELRPEAPAGRTVTRGRTRAGTREGDWLASPLRELVAFDAHGGLHPASGAAAAWQRLEAELAQFSLRTGWWGRVAGREARRQAALVRWSQCLRGAADAFSARRAELEGLARHRAARLHDRVEATGEVLEAAVAHAAQACGPQFRQQLAATQAELAEVARARPEAAARLADAEKHLATLDEAQTARRAFLAGGLEALAATFPSGRAPRPTRHFQYLLKQYEQLPLETWHADWQAACNSFDQAVRHLHHLRDGVDPAAVLAAIRADLDQDAQRLEQSAEKVRHNRRTVEHDLAAARQKLQALDEKHAAELDWWGAAYAALPEALRPPAASPAEVETADYVQAVLARSDGWKAALEQERAYLGRAEKLVTDWAGRLRRAGAEDRAELQQIYMDNANVIGITCVQAGAYQFSRQYRNFDCVIIDEVSKATPPELLLPMLKGARVVLVGDHKQLPPMIGPESLADLAAELNVDRAELDHLERSLFAELFEAASPELRVMLTEQYRMHPQIMEAINQFYADKLVCSLPEPDRRRAHGFDLPWLQPEQHLLWLNTPADGNFVEQKVGTTFRNNGEVEVILRLLRELDTAWAPQVARGKAPKEVGVITFYGAQVRELKERLVNRPAGQGFKNLRLRVGTVDRFQGMEQAIIICSLVRNNSHGVVGFARKPERVNVAFSRAQELLVIVGSRELFTERARSAPAGAAESNGAASATAIYGRVAEAVQRAGGLRRTTDVAIRR